MPGEGVGRGTLAKTFGDLENCPASHTTLTGPAADSCRAALLKPEHTGPENPHCWVPPSFGFIGSTAAEGGTFLAVPVTLILLVWGPHLENHHCRGRAVSENLNLDCFCLTSKCQVFCAFFKNPHPREDMFTDFGKRERERERNIDARKKHRLVASHMYPNWESNLQP